MSMSIIAMLLSLAMMLTGAGTAGAPAEAAKTLTISDVVFTYNDQTIELAPELRLGASTDGEKALFDFAVQLDGEALLPVQLLADAEGVTALAVTSGQAFQVPAETLEGLMAQVQEMLDSSMGAADEESQAILTYLKDRFVPAYAAMIALLGDEARVAEIQEKAQAVYDEIVDRGEGVAETVELDGATYEVTAYSYTIDADQLFRLVDAVYACDETLADYYDALFELYALLPEESGLRGIDSFAGMREKLGLEMSYAVEEKISEADALQMQDGVITVEFPATLPVPEGEEPADVAEIPPLVFNIHSVDLDGAVEGTFDCDYVYDDIELTFEGSVTQAGEAASVEISATVAQGGEDAASLSVQAYTQPDADTADKAFGMTYEVSVEEAADLAFSVEGASHADGTMEAAVDASAVSNEELYGLSFRLATDGAPIADAFEGADVTVISDLSEEGIQALTNDEGVQGKLMQVVGSFMQDVQKLGEDESVQQLAALFSADPDSMEETSDEDLEIEVEPEEGDLDFDIVAEDDEELVEDDGVLAFQTPEFTWLPEGWNVVETNVDTAYDWVDISIMDDDYENTLYAMFYADSENAEHYAVAADGTITPVEDRDITVSQPGAGSWNISMASDGVYAGMYIDSQTLDLETLGKIIAGITF